MKTLQEIHNELVIKFPNTRTDKGIEHSYIEPYEKLFEKYRDKTINLLEIGIWEGGSIPLWVEYFNEDSNIFGIDITLEHFYSHDFSDDKRFKVCKINATSKEDVKQFILDYKIDTFNIIIDDASHKLQETISSAINLLPFLSINGIYIVEDIGCFSNSILEEHKEFKVEIERYFPNRFDISLMDLQYVKNRWDDGLTIIRHKDNHEV